MVKAKFYVGSVQVHQVGPGGYRAGGVKSGQVHLHPVCRGAENKQWAQATPSGKIEMYVNGPAVEWFMERIGKELAITMDDAKNDPMTHAFEPLGDEYQPSAEDIERGYKRDETCVNCGQARETHSS